jgi:low temperature requirement protein LtrA
VSPTGALPLEPSTRRRPPRLRNAGGEATERRASALELFFDLVFVVAVAELTDTLLHEPTGLGLLHYCALFLPIWWAWVGYTFFADRFDNDDLVHRTVMLAAMLAVSSLAEAVPDAFASPAGSIRFAVSYVAVRVLLLVQYARVHACIPVARPLTGRYLVGFGAGAAIWLASVFVPEPARYACWAAGLVVELATPMASASAIKRVPFHTSHIPERFGLFVLIVLGESVTLDALGIASDRLDLMATLIIIAGFLIAAGLWWLYFDCVDPSPMRRWRWTGQAYVYGHAVVFAAIPASGAGVLLASRMAAGYHPQEGALETAVADPAVLLTEARWALCGGIAAFLFAIGAIHLVNTAPRGDLRVWSRVALGTAATLLAVFGAGLPPLAVEAALIVGLAAEIVLEVRLICATPPI